MDQSAILGSAATLGTEEQPRGTEVFLVYAPDLRELLRALDVMFSSERFFDRHRGCDPTQCNILQIKAARDRFTF